MDWEAIGSIGEITGALAVVVTLAYLALQVRVSRSVAADANRLTRVNGFREYALSATSNEKLLASMSKAYGLSDYYSAYGETFDLSEQEAARIDWAHQYFFWLHYGQWASTNDAKSTADLDKVIRAYYLIPAVRHTWEQGPFGRAYMDTDFAAYVDSLIDQERQSRA
jgi:hypothetical protein